MLELAATTKIEVYALIWLALLILTLGRRVSARGGSLGLPLAFILTYTFAYGGALIHLDDTFDPSLDLYLREWGYDRTVVADGFEAACLGILGACLGFVLADRRQRLMVQPSNLYLEDLRKKTLLLLIVGGGFTVVSKLLTNMGIQIPGLQAVFDTLRNLFFVGACAWVYYGLRIGGDRRALIYTGVFAVAVPAFLLVTTAILADSVMMAVVIICFYLSLLDLQRKKVFLKKIAIVSCVAGFSFIFAAAYMQSRQVLRAIVWNGGGMEDALQAISQSASQFEVGSLVDYQTLALLDARLDQGIFTGLAIRRLRAGQDTFESGATIGLALLGWVPRFLWPDKPERGGSAFIAKHTGLTFVDGVSFGAGPVFEFYVNFGYWGVLIGFIILGYVIRRLDSIAFSALHAGSFGVFTQCFLASGVLLAPLADLLFIVTSFATAGLLGWGLRFFWTHTAPSRLGRRLRTATPIQIT